ncbi:MAG: hypothetical protein ACNA8W_11135 [Bradymonadaceae bacterium]
MTMFLMSTPGCIEDPDAIVPSLQNSTPDDIGPLDTSPPDETGVDCGGPDYPRCPFIQAFAAYDFSCGLRSDGSAQCWGADGYRRLHVPDLVWTDIAGYGAFSCGIDVDKEMHCWGRNNFGQSSPPEL